MPWIGGAIIGGAMLGSSVLGGKNQRSATREGYGLDLQGQKEIFDFKTQRGIENGLTPYEVFAGPGGNASGGTSNMGQTMGNQAAQQTANINNAILQMGLKKMDNDTAKEVAGIQAAANKEVAGIQSDTQKLIAANKLSLDRDTYNNITIPESAAKLKISAEELKIKLNNVATSKPEFVKFMKMLTMGVDNTLSAFIQNVDGYNLTDPESVAKIPIEKREEILSMMLAIQSGTLKNVEGFLKIGSDVMENLPKLPNVKQNLGTGRKGGNRHMQHMINNAG